MINKLSYDNNVSLIIILIIVRGGKMMKNANDYPVVLGPKDIAEILGISVPSVYRFVQNGQIPSLPVGTVCRVSREVFFNWLNDPYYRNDFVVKGGESFENR